MPPLLFLLLLPPAPASSSSLCSFAANALHGTSPTPSISSRTTWARGRGRAAEEQEDEVEVGGSGDDDASIFDSILVTLEALLLSVAPFALWLQREKEIRSRSSERAQAVKREC